MTETTKDFFMTFYAGIRGMLAGAIVTSYIEGKSDPDAVVTASSHFTQLMRFKMSWPYRNGEKGDADALDAIGDFIRTVETSLLAFRSEVNPVAILAARREEYNSTATPAQLVQLIYPGTGDSVKTDIAAVSSAYDALQERLAQIARA